MEIKSRLVANGELYSVSYERLRKLAKDRGVNTDLRGEQLKLNVAYAEGYMVGKSEKAEKAYYAEGLFGKSEKAFNTQERTDYIIEDDYSIKVVPLTADQVRLLEWLFDNNYLEHDLVHVYSKSIERIEV